jgi:hypothetical protein
MRYYDLKVRYDTRTVRASSRGIAVKKYMYYISTKFSILNLVCVFEYCPFVPKWRVVFNDPLPPNLRTEGNFQARFSRRKSIEFPKLYRLTSSFFALLYVNISTRIFGDSVSCPGLYGGLYGQNLPYKFKKSYCDFRNRNFEKSHRTTGPRSDLRPDS